MYHVVKSETAALGRFRVHLDTVEMNDELFPYSYVEQKGSVGILGFDGEKIILIRQYRHSVKSYELEIPGGGMERGENPCETAAREMLEETGYVVSSLEDLGRYYPSPGSSDEICCLYAAACRKSQAPKREPLELMDVVLVDEDEFASMIQEGIFKHGMGLAAWLKYCMKRGRI